MRSLYSSEVHTLQVSRSLTVESGDRRRPQDGSIHNILDLASLEPHFSKDMNSNFYVTSYLTVNDMKNR